MENQLGDKIRILRRAQKLKQKQLADILSVAVATISEIESNKRMPRVDLLVRIAKFFGISVDALLQEGKLVTRIKQTIQHPSEDELPIETQEAIKRYIEFISPQIAHNFLTIQERNSIDQRIRDQGGDLEVITKLLEEYGIETIRKMTLLSGSLREILKRLISELAATGGKDEKAMGSGDVSEAERLLSGEEGLSEEDVETPGGDSDIEKKTGKGE